MIIVFKFILTRIVKTKRTFSYYKINNYKRINLNIIFK